MKNNHVVTLISQQQQTMNTKRYCEKSIRWILNYRRYGESFIKTNDYVDSGQSMLWVKSQSIMIDKIGFDEWMHSGRSMGYTKYLDYTFGKEKIKTQCTLKELYQNYCQSYMYTNTTYEQFLETLLTDKMKLCVDENGLYNPPKE